MLNALRPQNDIGAAPDHVFGPVQSRAGRQLNEVDEVALILFGDKAGRDLVKLEAGNGNQPDIDHEHDGTSAHKSTRQTSVAERELLEAAIEVVEYDVQQPLRLATMRVVM